VSPRARTLLAAIALAALAQGCGDDALWARWQAEQALYHARAAAHRALERTPRDEAELDRAIRRLAAIEARFPAERWVALTGQPGPARDVALASGRAALERAQILVARGQDEPAIEALGAIERAYAPLAAIVLPARQSRIDVLERTLEFEAAMSERFALAAMDPMADPESHGPLKPVLAAPLELAARLRNAGREAEARVELTTADSVLSRAIARSRGNDLVVLADGLSRVRSARHDPRGALAALREGLHASDPSRVAFFARALAARAFEAGAPESVFAYARWAASLNGTREVAGWVWFASALAWEALGRPDSSVADDDAILHQWIDPGPLGPEVRFHEAAVLEREGQWERALAGYNTLQARYPSDPLAFDAARRVVRHHLEHGQPEMARVAGEQTLHNLGYLLETDRDPLVQREALSARGDVLQALGRSEEAESTLLDLWRRFPEDSLAQDAGLRAARLAAARPGGVARGDSIRAALRHAATNAAVRRAAGASP
jgi:tetratricopeptide (TPR) repeat protein